MENQPPSPHLLLSHIPLGVFNKNKHARGALGGLNAHPIPGRLSNRPAAYGDSGDYRASDCKDTAGMINLLVCSEASLDLLEHLGNLLPVLQWERKYALIKKRYRIPRQSQLSKFVVPHQVERLNV